MFRALGIGVLIYSLYAIATGEVYTKSGWGGRTVARAESPAYFWIVVVIYLGLGVALLTVF